jgi:hypothetical protein
MLPVPEAKDELAVAVATSLAAATELTVEAGGTATAELVDPVMVDAVPVPFWAMAICSKSAWVLFAVGLMEKVMPFPQ